ncbi:type II toxin-antitoxin system RelE/ParE family toxin [Priestia aryabhattai]|uniref:type II toxin-antitoxin system RelE/ParE family toxin n=1 Tax=Priestia aryabhattai TaxID=412384 RepID=UPI003D2DA4F0
MANNVVHILRYPNLVLTKETVKGLGDKSMSKGVKIEVHKFLDLLNEYGNNHNHLNKRTEKTYSKHDIWEMKFKDKSNTEWRILFKKISKKTKPAQYALLTMFKKKTKKLSKQDLDKAEQIAKREGW